MNALNLIGYNLGSKIFGRVVNSLSGLEPGQRYPHPQWGPIVVPKTPELEAGEGTLRRIPRIQITFQGFLGLSAGLLWYAHRSSQQLGRIPEVKELPFPELKRELSLKAEDTAESDDPVEICLQRRYGWKLDRLQELRESIGDKSQPGLYENGEEELTKPEQELLENIDACLEHIKQEYGSLEAAGLELTDCPLCDNDD